MQKFYKGRTDNHLTWVMVDATDFATPESALSAAMKIKIYGKLRADNTVYFVSSGTGSLTNDIKHVGASVLGIYTIGLVKADLSDASAAWYDQYVISLSATGAAYQTLVVDGGIDDSNLSGVVSDLYSLLSDHHSDFQSRVPKRVATDSQLSDLASDLRSYLVVMSGVQSDVYSLLSDHHSDFQSRVPKRVATDSQISDMASDLRSFIAAGVTLDASTISDIRSAIAGGPAATVTASDISDIASAVWANTIGARVDSRILVAQSYLSDIRSHVSDLQSDFQSRVPKRVATDSQLSDMASDIKSAVAGVTATLSASDLSDIRSAITAAASDIRSLVSTTGPTISDIGSAVWADPAALLVSSRVSDIQSYLVVMSGIQSDIYSQLSDFRSDLHSFVSTTGVQVNASSLSDIRSAITAGGTATVSASDISDIASAVWANTIGARVDSRILVAQSYLSDIRSHVSDLQSDFQSRVPKRVATDSQLSDLASDIKSAVVLAPVNALNVDTYAEPAQGTPGATVTLATKIGFLYKAWRNKTTQTSTQYSLLNDDAVTVDHKASVSDDGTTFSKGEVATGP